MLWIVYALLCVCTSHTTSSGSCMHMHSLNIICTIFCKCWQAPGVFSFGCAFFVFLLHWARSFPLSLPLFLADDFFRFFFFARSILISRFALSSFSSIYQFFELFCGELCILARSLSLSASYSVRVYFFVFYPSCCSFLNDDDEDEIEESESERKNLYYNDRVYYTERIAAAAALIWFSFFNVSQTRQFRVRFRTKLYALCLMRQLEADKNEIV